MGSVRVEILVNHVIMTTIAVLINVETSFQGLADAAQTQELLV